MRLLELHLKAFGPFTDRRLDLSGGRQGLHLVFGPNEAGKSSALRALKALLYGFPKQTGDDFVHSYDQLRVGARLLLADGREVELLRRKGTRSTLLSPADESPLDDGLLDGCLQGVEEKLFSSLFGIDHDALVQGGQELLDQKGDVGQALFAAGLGTRNLRRVLQGLEEEAGQLYLGRGKRVINLQIAELQEAKRAMAQASLSGREWEGRRRDLERKREEWSSLERELAALESDRNRLQRLRRSLPRLADRRTFRERIDALGPVAPLPEDFPVRRREAQEAIRAARDVRVRAETELAELREEAAALTVSRAVLDQAETIERLHREVGRYAKDQTDRSRLLVERDERRATAEALLDEIRPGLTLDEAEALRSALDRWMRIQELGNQRQALVNAGAQAGRSVQEAERRLAALREALAALPEPRDPSELRRRIEAARKAGDLDRALAEAAGAAGREEEQLRLELARLGLWSGTAEELEALPVPPAETTERFREGLASLAERRRALGDRRAAHRTELSDLDRRLEEIRRTGEVPTEQDLAAARDHRNRLWNLLRPALAGGALPPEAQPDAYERSIETADEIADRLRREADRVQQQAQHLARRGQLEALLAEVESEDARASREQDRLQEEWKALWRPCGIEPLPPREMQAWAGRQERLRARAEALRELRRSAASLEESRRGHVAALLEALTLLASPEKRPKAGRSSSPLRGEGGAMGEGPGMRGPELASVLSRSEEVVRRLEEQGRERDRLAAELREAEAQLVQARADEASALASLEAWRQSWGEAIRPLGADPDALPSEVLQVVETLRKVFHGLQEAARLDHRIAGLDRDLESFRTAVLSLAAQLAPDLAGQPADQAAVQLQAMLTEARRRSERRGALDERREKLEVEIRDAEATRRTMEERLAGLVQEARCVDEGGLEAAERSSAELRRLREDLERTERELLRDGEGMSLDDLKGEAEGVDADALPGRIDRLARDIDELAARSGDLREEIGREQRELEHMIGGDEAARAAERAQEVLAGLRENVERYVRLRLASSILHQEIERYRAANQAPLLRRAGEHFAALTLASFHGLATDFDDRDEAVLVGLRSDGRKVRVDGMSEGSRDQLYLALRLATLERYLADAAEPLPFVVDDILIKFDDERSAATLKVLADLSARTQVILFTHHARLKDLAAGLQSGNGTAVFVRELG